MSNSGDDAVWIGGPDEGFGVMVGFGDETVDGGLEVDEGSLTSGSSSQSEDAKRVAHRTSKGHGRGK